jgi:hypothetical protein
LDIDIVFYAIVRSVPLPDFPLARLYEALDAQRQARGLTWTAAVAEMSAPFVAGMSRPLAASTVKGLSTKAVAEGDGVLQMLRWLGRTPESFIPGARSDARTALPAIESKHVFRFDTIRLHAALNEARTARGLTWEEAAVETRCAAASLTHLSEGGRTAFPHVMRLTEWLDATVAEFVRVTRR